MKSAWRFLPAVMLLLAASGTYRRIPQSPVSGQTNSPDAQGSQAPAWPQIISARFEQNQSQKISPEDLLPENSFDQWLSVSPMHRRSRMSHEAMEPFETILASLNLPPDRLLRLQELIVEREESAQDAEALSKDYWMSPGSTAIARAQAAAAFDQEMANVAGDANIQKIRQMLSLRPQLEQIVQKVGRDLDLSGAPMNADDLLQLAQIYKDSYAPPMERGFVNRMANFDSKTGLGDIDRQTLARAAALLTPGQLDVLRIDLAMTTTIYATQP